MLFPTIASVVDASLDPAFVLDAQKGNVLHINPSGRRLFDCHASPDKEGDGMRKNYSSFFTFVDPELSQFDENGGSAWSKVIEPLAKLKKSDDASSSRLTECYDVTACLLDGSAFDASVSLTLLAECSCCSPPEDGSSIVCAYLRETSTKQQRYITSLEREIRRFESYETALDASFDAFFGISMAGTILYVNRAAVKAFGWVRTFIVLSFNKKYLF